MVFFVIGPAFAEAVAAGLEQEAAARRAWHVGMCSIVVSGVFKMACAFVADPVRRFVPRAALLGSLTAIALALITFLPLLEVFASPIAGLVALGIVLATLTAHLPFPGRIPGMLAALVVGGLIQYVGQWVGWIPDHGHMAIDPAAALWPTDWLAAFRCEWLDAWPETLKYLPIVIPFALGTVVGGIDCTESAAAAGDEYDTGRVIGVEALATVVAGLCGGVIQTTPYIGQPAYKAMGGRAAYTLATALFIGLAGLTGTFAYLYQWLPMPALVPILVFVGLEITAQSFHATPQKHYPAVALACVPALAALAKIETDKVLAAGATPDAVLARELFSLQVISAGFIVTSVLWAGMLAALLDRRPRLAAGWCLAAATTTLCGVIHSPFKDGRLFLPWAVGDLPVEAAGRGPLELAAAYGLLAILFACWPAARPTDYSSP